VHCVEIESEWNVLLAGLKPMAPLKEQIISPPDVLASWTRRELLSHLRATAKRRVVEEEIGRSLYPVYVLRQMIEQTMYS